MHEDTVLVREMYTVVRVLPLARLLCKAQFTSLSVIQSGCLSIMLTNCNGCSRFEPRVNNLGQVGRGHQCVTATS